MPEAAPRTSPPRTWFLTRFVLLRALGFVYTVAFLIAAHQILPLIGSDGLTPAAPWMALVHDHFGSRTQAFLHVPSLFWFAFSDHLLVSLAWLGFGLSLLVLAGFANSILMAVLWALYMSYVHIGQIWYGYGWEIQLLETGFLAIFLCPVLDPRPFSTRPPPILILWLYRWLGFRILLGAGLIKLRGDSCWHDLTCLYYHYETQPLPNPLSRILHFSPHWFSKFMVLWNHFIELVVPWFCFGPRTVRIVAGCLMISFQCILIVSGNLAFLNWLTIIPFIACLDDDFLRRFLPASMTHRFPLNPEPLSPTALQRRLIPPTFRNSDFALQVFRLPSLCVFLLVAYLSISPVLNMLSGSQAMNASFDPLDLVNTYGAFGSVGKDRREIVFEGTTDDLITDKTIWREYQFPYKPGDLARRPPIITPYYGRLDWQIWFAAMASPAEYPWTLNFVWKLLHNDSLTLSLLADNPFPAAPPHYIRARLYTYRFAPPGSGQWWTRTLTGDWLPPLSISDLQDTIQSQPWIGE